MFCQRTAKEKKCLLLRGSGGDVFVDCNDIKDCVTNLFSVTFLCLFLVEGACLETNRHIGFLKLHHRRPQTVRKATKREIGDIQARKQKNCKPTATRSSGMVAHHNGHRPQPRQSDERQDSGRQGDGRQDQPSHETTSRWERRGWETR